MGTGTAVRSGSGARQHGCRSTATPEQYMGSAEPRPRLRVHGRDEPRRAQCHGQGPRRIYERLPQPQQHAHAGAERGHRRGEPHHHLQPRIHPREDEGRGGCRCRFRRNRTEHLRLERDETRCHRQRAVGRDIRCICTGQVRSGRTGLFRTAESRRPGRDDGRHDGDGAQRDVECVGGAVEGHCRTPHRFGGEIQTLLLGIRLQQCEAARIHRIEERARGGRQV